MLNAGRAGSWPHEAWVHSSSPESPLLLWKPQSTRKTLTYMPNPDEHEKPYLHATPATTRKTLANMKTLEYKEKPNLHEKPYLRVKPAPTRKP